LDMVGIAADDALPKFFDSRPGQGLDSVEA